MSGMRFHGTRGPTYHIRINRMELKIKSKRGGESYRKDDFQSLS
jgi:hypothetical protein